MKGTAPRHQSASLNTAVFEGASSLWGQRYRKSQVKNKISSFQVTSTQGRQSQLALTKLLRTGSILAFPPCITPNICIHSMLGFPLVSYGEKTAGNPDTPWRGLVPSRLGPPPPGSRKHSQPCHHALK